MANVTHVVIHINRLKDVLMIEHNKVLNHRDGWIRAQKISLAIIALENLINDYEGIG